MSQLKKLFHGIGWGAISTGTVVALQLVFMAIMARLLSPADFGLVAIANVCLRFLSYFSQMGISPAIVQKKQLSASDLAAALSVSLTISAISFLAIVLLAPWLAAFFEMPQLQLVIQVLSINFILTGLFAVSGALVRREMRFKALALIEMLSYVAGYGCVGIVMATQGYGVWALVGATLTQSLVTGCASYFVSRHALSVRHDKASRAHFISFGGRFSVIGFLEFLSSNLDAILIGKFFGEAISGLYNRALLVANLPIQQPANVFSRALFPLLSKMDDSNNQQLKALQLSTLVVGGYAFAVSAGISAASANIIAVLLGEKWHEAAAILEILSFSVGPLFVSHVFGVTYDSLGRLNEKLRIQCISLVLLVALIVSGVSYGIHAIAWSIVIAESVRMLLYLFSLQRVFGIGMHTWLPIYVSHFTLASLAYLCVFASNQLLHSLHPGLQLAVNIMAGVLALLLSFFLLRKTVMQVDSVHMIIAKLPWLERIFGHAGNLEDKKNT